MAGNPIRGNGANLNSPQQDDRGGFNTSVVSASTPCWGTRNALNLLFFGQKGGMILYRTILWFYIESFHGSILNHFMVLY